MGNSSAAEAAAATPTKTESATKVCEGDSCSLQSKPADAKPKSEQQKPLKACCACPETKKARDACIMEKGEENCAKLIEAHKECMRKLGFKI